MTLETLEDVRGKISGEQLEILDAIWNPFTISNANQGPSVRSIHLRFGKDAVLSAIRELPPGAIYTTSNQQYRLTLLGLMVSSQGPTVEQLLIDYLEYLRAEARENPDISIAKSEELRQARKLSESDIAMLGQAILLGQFWSGTHSLGGTRWNCGVPDDIDEFPSIGDFRAYVLQRAFSDAEQTALTSIASGHASRKGELGDFWFISNPALRKQLAADRQEMLRVRSAKAWKSCVILCGGIVEGMLVDILGRNLEAARGALSKRRRCNVRPMDEWVLADLVDAAHELGILPTSAIHLGHALREYRNLIHPGRQQREGAQLTSHEADVAVLAVEICFRELTTRADMVRVRQC